MSEQRRPIPRLTSSGHWSQYGAGIVTETVYVLLLSAIGLGLAFLMDWIAG